MDFNSLKTSFDITDYTEFVTFTSDLIILEIVTKICVCFYEALWTMHGLDHIGGATPGKFIMGLRIVHAVAILPLDAQRQQQFTGDINNNNNNNVNNDTFRALLYPATNLGFLKALYRSVTKNVVMALLFPMCFITFLFRNNQTIYDILTKTIVVEENQMPIFRRRR